jgi:hypothetical protein
MANLNRDDLIPLSFMVNLSVMDILRQRSIEELILLHIYQFKQHSKFYLVYGNTKVDDKVQILPSY